jgi:hypothetical protein
LHAASGKHLCGGLSAYEPSALPPHRPAFEGSCHADSKRDLEANLGEITV